MLRTRLSLFVFGFLVSACASSAPGPETEPMSADDWQSMNDEGLAMAPVVGVEVVAGNAEGPAFFSDELYVVLQAALPGTSVLSPDEVYGRLEVAGSNAQSRLRSVRRHLVRLEPLDVAETEELSADLGYRYILVVFVDEGSEEGIHRTNLDDLKAFNYSMGVHRYPTDELHGIAIGFVVDLAEGREVWRGDVEYESEGLGTTESGARRIIDRTRADAAFRLTESLAIASPND